MRHVALWSAAVLALAAAPGALADGYAGYALQTGTGVVSANGKVRYVAVAAGAGGEHEHDRRVDLHRGRLDPRAA